jgi:hypothetical protein
MRSIDLAVWADALAGQASQIASRLERARAAIRQEAIEHEARAALPDAVVARLDSIGALHQPTTGAELVRGEVEELLGDLRSLELLQAWVEERLAACRGVREGGEATAEAENQAPFEAAA